MKTILNSLALLLITVTVSVASDKTVIRVGHFPNITHAQGLIAHNLSRQGKGWFEARLGPGVEIQWFTYNAGPSAMEAIFAKSIELTYVGPEFIPIETSGDEGPQSLNRGPAGLELSTAAPPPSG